MTPTQTTPDRFAVLLARLEDRLDPLTESLLGRVRDKHPELGRRAGLDRDRLAALTRASLRTQLRGFRQGVLPVRCSEADAAAVAALGPAVGLQPLLDGCRLCQLTLWQAWFELVEDSLEPGAPERRELLARGSDFFFRYAEALGVFIAEAYERQAPARLGNGEQRRLRALTKLLEGDPLAASSLDLDLNRHHLGIVAWGEGARDGARELAARLDRPLFCVSAADREGSSWGWLSGTRPLGSVELRRLLALRPPAARIALGVEAFGAAGFRSSHRQALRAQRLAPRGGPAIQPYSDVAVEALACENEDDARTFVAHELRGISDDSAGSDRLRETLSAYFAAGFNAASAAARLGVHQQTVANRLRAVEQRLGQTSIGLRRVELEMALRLRECLASEGELGP